MSAWRDPFAMAGICRYFGGTIVAILALSSFFGAK
jgi:hypothetical protein